MVEVEISRGRQKLLEELEYKASSHATYLVSGNPLVSIGMIAATAFATWKRVKCCNIHRGAVTARLMGQVSHCRLVDVFEMEPFLAR